MQEPCVLLLVLLLTDGNQPPRTQSDRHTTHPGRTAPVQRTAQPAARRSRIGENTSRCISRGNSPVHIKASVRHLRGGASTGGGEAEQELGWMQRAHGRQLA
jgi:hypothetical protein